MLFILCPCINQNDENCASGGRSSLMLGCRFVSLMSDDADESYVAAAFIVLFLPSDAEADSWYSALEQVRSSVTAEYEANNQHCMWTCVRLLFICLCYDNLGALVLEI